MVQHALDDNDKQARRAAILDAARTLFLAAPDRLPSAAAIAHSAGLAKGTVYLYFRTKEEIFMALLQEDWATPIADILHVFRPSPQPPQRRIAAFIKRYVDYLADHPELLRLDALGYSVLERNLSFELLVRFKLEFAHGLAAAGHAVETALHLPKGHGVRLLNHTYALTRGLWQALDHPESCRTIMADPAWPLPHMDFRTELKRSLTQYWRGLQLPAE
jgi:AcrR family transcriptional regulator